MKDLARLGIGGRIEFCRLIGRKMQQNAPRNCRVEPEHFPGGDQRVTPEHGAEPGYARIGIGPLLRIGHEHVEVRDRTAHGLVEDLVGALHRGRAGRGTPECAARVPQRAEKQARRRILGPIRVAADLDKERTRFAGGEAQTIDGFPRLKLRRRRIETQSGATWIVVEPPV